MLVGIFLDLGFIEFNYKINEVYIFVNFLMGCIFLNWLKIKRWGISYEIIDLLLYINESI